jgi:curli production assembly/transport component CsgF
MRIREFAIACLMGMSGFTPSAFATEQIYRPVSPTFGGNPLNGNFLLSTAQTQGSGAKSGPQQQSPDLSGLNSALSNIGNTGSSSPIVIVSPGTTPANP